MSRKQAVFLDRDGTMAKDVHYCSRPEDFELFTGVPGAIKKLNDHGFKVVVVTNQSGVGRGFFTEDTLRLIHEKMVNNLTHQGAKLDGIYYCPHHPNENCNCRKPKIGLLVRAKRDLEIDFKRSYMVGDMALDIEVGQAVGCKTILITGGDKIGKITVKPDQMTSNLAEAIDWILKTENDGI